MGDLETGELHKVLLVRFVRVGKLTNKNKGKIGHPTEVADSEATYKREHVRRTNHEETTRDTETGATQGKWVREKDGGFVERLWVREKDSEIRINMDENKWGQITIEQVWDRCNGTKSAYEPELKEGIG